MNSGLARQLYLRYCGAIAYVAVERNDGTHGIGSAFHVGEGVFVTARHVVEDRTIREVGISERAYIELRGEEVSGATFFGRVDGDREIPMHLILPHSLEIATGPFYHPNGAIDVAAFKATSLDPKTPVIALGSHLDDLVGQTDFVLDEVVVLGYPPIPLTGEPYLVAARAEVNAQIDIQPSPHIHFVLSATPRGGFSGAPAITEQGFTLGVVTKSLLTDGASAELGYFTVMSVEPIYECLAAHKLLPDCQAVPWEGLWNTTTEDFDEKDKPGWRGTAGGSIGCFDDGKRLALEIHCANAVVYESAVSAALDAFAPLVVLRADVHPRMVKLTLQEMGPTAREKLERARRSARQAFLDGGLIPATPQ